MTCTEEIVTACDRDRVVQGLTSASSHLAPEPLFYWDTTQFPQFRSRWLLGLGAVEEFECPFEDLLTARRWLDAQAPLTEAFGLVPFDKARQDEGSTAVHCRFVVPRVLVEEVGPQRFRIRARGKTGAAARDQLSRTVRDLECRQAESEVQPTETNSDSEVFCANVRSALAQIQERHFEKVVLYRTSQVDSPPSLGAALSRMATIPLSVHFAARFDGRCFIGASPEMLVRKQDDHLESEALAGSHRDPPAGWSDGPKIAIEHSVVVDAIASTLAELGRGVRVGSSASRDVGYIHHLSTKVECQGVTGLHVLDCLRKLHPTPALAGMPKDASLRFLRSHESPRGWFGGPVGWMDRDGNGEFAVGIRAALHEGSSARMFAGAGIVEGSIPEQEWEETDQKLNVMRYVLGLSEEAPWLPR